jgi:hypothetical protein
MTDTTQPTTEAEERPTVNIETILVAFSEAEKQLNMHLWQLEERVRLLEGTRDREFEHELNRRLNLPGAGGKISEDHCESGFSRLARLSRHV